ncbi:hypothetical protein HK096_005517 [Nowakowskiella sp. JEL0078]|nr:hypothetical protein HK096_005517 [Nowakowskiella sp. JEL0078]
MFPFEPLGNRALKQLAAFVNLVCASQTSTGSVTDKSNMDKQSPKIPVSDLRFVRHYVKFYNNSKCLHKILEKSPSEVVKAGEMLLNELMSREKTVTIGGYTLGLPEPIKESRLKKMKTPALIVSKMLLRKGRKKTKANDENSDGIEETEPDSLLHRLSAGNLDEDIVSPNRKSDGISAENTDNEGQTDIEDMLSVLSSEEEDNENEEKLVDEEVSVVVAIEQELDTMSKTLSEDEKKKVAFGVRMFFGTFLKERQARL